MDWNTNFDPPNAHRLWGRPGHEVNDPDVDPLQRRHEKYFLKIPFTKSLNKTLPQNIFSGWDYNWELVLVFAHNKLSVTCLEYIVFSAFALRSLSGIGPKVDRSQSLFYFVPHSQAGSTNPKCTYATRVCPEWTQNMPMGPEFSQMLCVPQWITHSEHLNRQASSPHHQIGFGFVSDGICQSQESYKFEGHERQSQTGPKPEVRVPRLLVNLGTPV